MRSNYRRNVIHFATNNCDCISATDYTYLVTIVTSQEATAGTNDVISIRLQPGDEDVVLNGANLVTDEELGKEKTAKSELFISSVKPPRVRSRLMEILCSYSGEGGGQY